MSFGTGFAAALGEWKLAARCCELLSEAMRTFPESSELQTWAAFALYQLAMCHSESEITMMYDPLDDASTPPKADLPS